MSKSFYIINSEKKHKFYIIGFVLSISFSFIIPFVTLLIKPTLFYFRAWEYFPEMVYSNLSPPVWKGYERGDQSRGFYFRFQEKHYTYVSTDEDGFRVTPFVTNHYRILVYGDSHCWGSGLSDDQTFPWKLSLKLKEPVYNGGRQILLGKILGKKELKETYLIINVIDAMHIMIRDIFPDKFVIEKYKPLKDYAKIPISLKRFYPSCILIRDIKRILNDLTIPKIRNEYTCSIEYKVPFFDKQIDKLDKLKNNSNYEYNFNNQVKMISNFSRQLSRLGYTYVLVLVPRKDLLYSKKVDKYSEEYFPRLIKKLQEKGVYAVDLQEIFIANKDRGLYFKTDSHWNENGTEIAADMVAKYLKDKKLLKDSKS